MTASATATKPKIRRRRPVVFALWSHALVDAARERGLRLHEGRPRLEWEQDGFVERKATVRGAICAECGQRIEAGTLALYAFSGDRGRTPYERYLHLERCTAACRDCGFFPCRCRFPRAAAPAPVSPDVIAARGLEHPERLSLAEVRAVCELALSVSKGEVA